MHSHNFCSIVEYLFCCGKTVYTTILITYVLKVAQDVQMERLTNILD